MSACNSYHRAKKHSFEFVSSPGTHIVDYFVALENFETCISECWKFSDTLRSFPATRGAKKFDLFNGYQSERLKNISEIYNSNIKHVAEKQRVFGNDQISIPLWLSNEGIKTENNLLTYSELSNQVISMYKQVDALHTMFERAFWEG